jgi:hypothetical protein
MHDESTRQAILRLGEAGHGPRAIARALQISRGAVKKVLAAGTAEVPALARAELGEPYREQILELLARCKGNLVRVHEELVGAGATLSYQALTAFCRRHELGRVPPRPAGRYDFAPGEEAQHDTSPHQVSIRATLRSGQTASLALCFSRMLFFQIYPRFTRFECKVFLTEAALYFEGTTERTMIDNTHLVVLSGTGRDMVPVPEMAAFAERFGTVFVAHEKGDANRSARVERPFDHIENNFLAGRDFEDWAHVNREARLWCDKVNAAEKRSLHASPRDLFATERLRLRPLPAHVPEVYQLHERIVDIEGYVNVHRIRYSAPWRLIGHRLEVRETKDRVDLYDGPRRVASHARILEPLDARVTLPEHRPPRSAGVFAKGAPAAEEKELAAAGDEVRAYVALLKKRGRSLRVLRRLCTMVREYPRAPLCEALRVATHYGLDDLDRLEGLVLRRIAGDFFLPSAADVPVDDTVPGDTPKAGEDTTTKEDNDDDG